MIGLVPLKRFSPENVAALIAKSPFSAGAPSQIPTYAVVTNSTYDGLCYDVDRVVTELAKSVSRIHFDEAWYAYAKFHHIYKGRYAMGVPDDMPDRPAIFAVQSTHKMLAAFSMASMVHIKLSPRAPLDFDQFNEAFMMHGTTSPFYPLIASLDVAAAMMDEPAGPTLMSETLQDAISFRKAMSSIAHRLREAEQGWFFRLYQPEYVFDPMDGQTYLLEEAADGLLTNTVKLLDAEARAGLARLPGRRHRRWLLHAGPGEGHHTDSRRQRAGGYQRVGHSRRYPDRIP